MLPSYFLGFVQQFTLHLFHAPAVAFVPVSYSMPSDATASASAVSSKRPRTALASDSIAADGSSVANAMSSSADHTQQAGPAAAHDTSSLPATPDASRHSSEHPNQYRNIVETICSNESEYVLPQGSSITDDVIQSSIMLLRKLENAAEEQIPPDDDDEAPKSNEICGCTELDLAHQAHYTSLALRKLMVHHGAKGGKGRKAIKAVGAILHSNTDNNDMLSSAIATVLVVSALSIGSIEDDEDGCNGHRSIRRAAASGILPDKPIYESELDKTEIYNCIAGRAVQSLLDICKDGNEEPSGAVDLHIAASIFRIFVQNNEPLASRCANVVKSALQLPDDGKFDENTDLPDIDKVDAAAALGLAAQIGPWGHLKPCVLVELSVDMHLWHAAERICTSAVSFASKEQIEDAVHILVDLSSDMNMYRQADAFATQFYDHGGRSRYAEARLMHAYDTITKILARRQFPILEKQVERVDRAYERVKEGIAQNKGASEDEKQSALDNNGPSEVRDFAILKLQETGEDDAAARLAKIWGIEYSYDEEEAARRAEERRAKYLQWEDCTAGKQSPVPELLSDSAALLQCFEVMEKSRSGPIGFDCEFGDETYKEAALLQVSTINHAILVDIPALTSTEEGCRALEQTVGRLFSSNRPVIGFSCREDVSRLRASPSALPNGKHWLGHSTAVTDVKPLIGIYTPKLKHLGLSKCCDYYLGKPLDKAEQCSLWMRRPLSIEQRGYAALDAWACTAIYSKIIDSVEAMHGY